MTNARAKFIVLDHIPSDKYHVRDLLAQERRENPRTFIFFHHEWVSRGVQISNHIDSYSTCARSIQARKCTVREIDAPTHRSFCEEYHIQGSNRLSVVCFGIFDQDELVGVLSLGRHHRNVEETVLDRMCFKHGVRVVGGASKLFSRAIAWCKLNGVREISSFSENRYSLGIVYEKLGFQLDLEIEPDYLYISRDDISQSHSKQSQKKSAVNCPDGMTERQFAEQRGFAQVFDAGKKRWYYTISTQRQVNNLVHRRHGYYETKKGKPKVIYYQSSYELRAATLLDDMENVRFYTTQVPFSIRGNKRIIDFLVTWVDGSISIIEIKPERRLDEFKDQLDDNRFLADSKGWSMQIWGETELGFTSEHYITKWADEFLSQIQPVNYVQERKERNLSKAAKHYRSKIATNTVTVFCQYCNEEHTALKLTHDRNIARNGRYICEREGGHIAGSKPKLSLRKVNPYASEGKKQCKDCERILEFASFSPDKTKTDGYCTLCKECRRAKMKARYQAKKRPPSDL